MRNPRRDRLEYMLYATVMTGTTVALGLVLIFGFDEHGKRRTPVMDQPFEESLREANMEMKEYVSNKYKQGEKWADDRGYGDLYRKMFPGGANTTISSSTTRTTASMSTTTTTRQISFPQGPGHKDGQKPASFLDTMNANDKSGLLDEKPKTDRNQRWWA